MATKLKQMFFIQLLIYQWVGLYFPPFTYINIYVFSVFLKEIFLHFAYHSYQPDS